MCKVNLNKYLIQLIALLLFPVNIILKQNIYFIVLGTMQIFRYHLGGEGGFAKRSRLISIERGGGVQIGNNFLGGF